MQRLVISLYTKQWYAGDKTAHAAIHIDPNQLVSRAVSCFFKDGYNNHDKKNHIKGKKVLTRLVHKSIFDTLYYSYNQFCHLLNKTKNKLVNKRRLIDLSGQYFSNAVCVSNFRELLAYAGQVYRGILFAVSCNRLHSNAGRLVLSNAIAFAGINAAPRFKTDERGAAMA